MEDASNSHTAPVPPPARDVAHMFPPDGVAMAPGGMFHHLFAWLGAWLKWLQLRSRLALLEAREAGAHYGVIAALLAGALVLMLFGYLFLVTTAVFGIAASMEGPHVWIKVMGGAALFHLLAAGTLVFIAKARLKGGVFAMTKEEFRKDRECLNKLQDPPKIG